MFARPTGFTFLDPGPLVDRDLELVRPSAALLDEWVRGSLYPDPPRDREHEETAHRIMRETQSFLRQAPNGMEIPMVAEGELPTYHFWMRLHTIDPATPRMMVGSLNLRISHSIETERHYGHVGYRVFPQHRGAHFAERSCRLLFGLARRHGLQPLWITCNPDNIPSRRTCERLGGTLVEIVTLPEGHPLRSRGETQKCRYRIQI